MGVSRFPLAGCGVEHIDHLTFELFKGKPIEEPIITAGVCTSDTQLIYCIYCTFCFIGICFHSCLCAKNGYLVPGRHAVIGLVQVSFYYIQHKPV